MTQAAIPLIIASTAVTAGSAVLAGVQAKRQGEEQQKIAEFNAAIEERRAVAERDAALDASRKFEERGKRLTGAQRVAFAKGGVLASEGTPLLVMEETLADLEEDRLRIAEEGFLRGSFFESSAQVLRAQCRSFVARGRAARTGSILSAGGSLLTGGARVAAAIKEKEK